MNNDLISRSALKKSLNFVYDCDYIGSKSKEGIASDIIEHIDNAPTVEPFEPDYVGAERLKARQRGYEEGYHYGMEIGKTLNPKIKQGEWQTQYETVCGFKYEVNNKACSNCGHTTKFKFPHCPWCGACMRGEKND